MTLDEAIKHAEEVAEENEKFCYKKGGKGGYFNEDIDWNNTKCAEEHRQLAEWLKDYKRLLEQEPCDDAVSRQAVLDAVSRIGLRKSDIKEVQAVAECLRTIEALPPVRLQELKTGWWIKKEYWKPLPYDTEPLDYDNYDEKTHSEKVYHYYCSKCDRDEGEIKPTDNYCPNCGARMVEPQESEE